MWSLSQVAKPIYEQYFSWVQTQGLLSALPSLLATQAQILVHSTALQTGHQELGLAITPVERTPCLQYKPEGVSITTKRNLSRTHTSILAGAVSATFFMIANSNLHLCQDSSATPWAMAGSRRWWLLSQLQRSSGFWKKGWAVTWDQEALVFKESP